MHPQLRIARPVTDLHRSAAMYRAGLRLLETGRFENHAGFDGVMLGSPGSNYHFEFTYCRAHPIIPSPTAEDLIVFYLPDRDEWEQACVSMVNTGFVEVASFNPYWQQRGKTFEDHDRYRVVLQQAPWGNLK